MPSRRRAALPGRLRGNHAHVLACERLEQEGHLVHLPGHLLADIEKCLALFHSLTHFVDALKLHHLQRTHGLLRPLGVEEARRIQLLGPLVLFHAAERVFLLGLDFQVEDGLAE